MHLTIFNPLPTDVCEWCTKPFKDNEEVTPTYDGCLQHARNCVKPAYAFILKGVTPDYNCYWCKQQFKDGDYAIRNIDGRVVHYKHCRRSQEE